MFHVHNRISSGIKYHSRLTILSLPTENRLSYLLYVTQGLTKYPASKGAQWLLWLKRSIKMVKALEANIQNSSIFT